MFVYIEGNQKITAYCPDGGISENEYWKFTKSEITEPITEEHGVPIYKLEDGEVVQRTAEEIKADIEAIPEPTPEPTVEERIAELNAMLDALLEGRQE